MHKRYVNSPVSATREVSGVIKDDKDEVMNGALVILKSKRDTIQTTTNEDGVFVFSKVKESTFNITIKSLGTDVFIKKYFYDGASRHITLDPINLKIKTTELSEIKIKGTPGIIYKTDTVEYKASDYKVRENATLDELLKKMEGIEVGKNGTLLFQGQQVTKANLNGKEYAGGDVAQAIQNLPADIIEKVQIVNDYGIIAEKTGIKDGESQKVLNVTTKLDRSIGTTSKLSADGGNNDRYNGALFLQQINANQQLGFIGSTGNTVNGVISSNQEGSSGAGGSSGPSPIGTSSFPGVTKSTAPSFNYRDQWSKKVQVISGYAYQYVNNNSINNSFGQRYTNLGTSYFSNQNESNNRTYKHAGHIELDYSIDSANYLQINSRIDFLTNRSLITGTQDNINNYSSGFEHQVNNGLTSNTGSNNNINTSAFFLHLFRKPKRVGSILVNLTRTNDRAVSGSNKNYSYYGDSTLNNHLKDSVVNLSTKQSNANTIIQTTATYVEPLGTHSQLNFRGDFKISLNNSKFQQDTVLTNDKLEKPLGNTFDYKMELSHSTVNYAYNSNKINFSIGLSQVGYFLSNSQSDFKVVPAFRFAYTPSKSESMQLNYYSTYNEPNFQYLQPFVDRSDPINVKIGNPFLHPSFTNSISASYNNYMANSKLNLALNVNANSINDQITTNIVQLKDPITSTPSIGNIYRTVNEINYVNSNGARSVITNYSITKQFNDRKYDLSLNGNITYNYDPYKSNDQLYHTTNWRFDERLGSKFNPNENIEINPYVAFKVDRTFTTDQFAQPNTYKIYTLAVDGKLYFFKNLVFAYSAMKNYINTTLGGSAKDPFVINLGLRKEFLKKRNLTITFDVYDILHQNTFLQQIVTPQGITNTLSNSLSRYFMIGARLNLQRWNGTPMRNGKPMRRKGDGSFIY